MPSTLCGITPGWVRARVGVGVWARVSVGVRARVGVGVRVRVRVRVRVSFVRVSYRTGVRECPQGHE